MKAKGWDKSTFRLASELKSAEHSKALCDNKIDVLIHTAGHPTCNIKEAATTCDTVYSDTSLVVVNPQPVAGTISGGLICPGEDLTFTITGSAGDTLRWESCTDGFSTAVAISDSNNITLTVSPNDTTSYRAIVGYSYGVCLEDTTNVDVVNVNDTVTPGTLDLDSIRSCATVNQTFTMIGATVNSYQWQE